MLINFINIILTIVTLMTVSCSTKTIQRSLKLENRSKAKPNYNVDYYSSPRRPYHSYSEDNYYYDNYYGEDDSEDDYYYDGYYGDYDYKASMPRRRKTTTTSTTTTRAPPPYCVYDYYVERNVKVDWDTANKSCVERGMDGLARANTLEKLSVIGSSVNLKDSSPISFWIGGYKDRKGFWIWEYRKGQLPMKFTNWADGEPNNRGENEDCLEMYDTFKWNDLPCSNKAFFICEKYECENVK